MGDDTVLTGDLSAEEISIDDHVFCVLFQAEEKQDRHYELTKTDRVSTT